MRLVSTQSLASSILATDKCGSFSAVTWQRVMKEAKMYWPRNTAKHFSRITGASIRTCYRWLSEGTEPPGGAIVAIMLAMRQEYVARGRIFEQLDFNFGQ